MQIFGIDVGGSGIKGAPVDTETGELLAERVRIVTPNPSTPQAIVRTAGEVVRRSGWEGPVGCGFPAVVKGGVVRTAANISKENIGFDLAAALEEEIGFPAHVVNDADAAGMAEVKWGAARGASGIVFVVTLGTGLGTALFEDGQLIPNTELGHIEVRGKEAEERASDRVRKLEDLSWKKYAKRLDEYLGRIEALFWPDLFVLGGGISKKSEKFLPFLNTQAEVVAAKMQNEAGIAGAALAAVPQKERHEVAQGT